MTSFRWLTCTFRLYPHPRISTATVQLITPYFTVFFKLCSPNCSSFQYHPTPFSHHQTQWFQPSCNFLLILCLSPLYLPPSQSKSSLVSVRCRVLGTPYFHLLPSLLLQGTPFTTSVGYTLGKRWWAMATEVLYSFSLPQQPTLLCPLACIFTVNSAKECPPFFFPVQQLTQQDLNTTWYSFWTSGNTFLLSGWLNAGTGCPQRLSSLHSRRYYKTIWTQFWQWALDGPAWVTRVGLDDLHRSLPTAIILWYIFTVFK